MNKRHHHVIQLLALARLLVGGFTLLCWHALAQTPDQLSIYPAVELQFVTDQGRQYQVEGSANFLDWVAVGEPRCGTGTPMTLLLSTRDHPNLRFYRLQIGGPASCTPTSARDVNVIGHTDHVTIAANFLGAGGIVARQNTTPASTDVVLFAVSAVDGSMPGTRNEIDAIKGKPHGPAAIWVVDGFRQTDPDLRALVIMEMKELLKSLQQPGADSMPVIFDDDPTALDQVRALLAQ